MRVAILRCRPEDVHLLKSVVESLGHEAEVFPTESVLGQSLGRKPVDLIILDWSLPDRGGVASLETIRSFAFVPPIVVVTNKTPKQLSVAALQAGADEYIRRPLTVDSVSYRIASMLRTHLLAPAYQPEAYYGDIKLTRLNKTLEWRGHRISFRPQEFDLLDLLFRHQGHCLSRAYIMRRVWGNDEAHETRTLDTHLAYVRSKLRLYPELGVRIVAISGYGYRLERAKYL